MLSIWLVAEIESGPVFKSLQKYINRTAEKQGQLQKLCSKMLSKLRVTGIENGKVFKSLQKYIIRIAKSKDSFKNYVSKCYQTGLWLE